MSYSEDVYAFVDGKISLLQSKDSWAKGMLAKLRHGAGKDPADTPEIWEITFGDLPQLHGGRTDDVGATKAELAIHVALTLYSIHQQSTDNPVSIRGDSRNRRSLGTASRLLISSDEKRKNGVKRKFDALITASDIIELSYHARSLVQMMRTADVQIQIDYPELAKDLYLYQFPELKQKRLLSWGRDFYRAETNENRSSE
jgi:CRISPR system Cascade subunit CasB